MLYNQTDAGPNPAPRFHGVRRARVSEPVFVLLLFHVNTMTHTLPPPQGCAEITGPTDERRAGSHPDLLPQSCIPLTASQGRDGCGQHSLTLSRLPLAPRAGERGNREPRAGPSLRSGQG